MTVTIVVVVVFVVAHERQRLRRRRDHVAHFFLHLDSHHHDRATRARTRAPVHDCWRRSSEAKRRPSGLRTSPALFVTPQHRRGASKRRHERAQANGRVVVGGARDIGGHERQRSCNWHHFRSRRRRLCRNHRLSDRSFSGRHSSLRSSSNNRRLSCRCASVSVVVMIVAVMLHDARRRRGVMRTRSV